MLHIVYIVYMYFYKFYDKKIFVQIKLHYVSMNCAIYRISVTLRKLRFLSYAILFPLGPDELSDATRTRRTPQL